MKDFSTRAKLSLAGATVALLAAGGIGAVAIPAAAQGASRAPVAVHTQASSSFLLQVCLTIREIHLGPDCITI